MLQRGGSATLIVDGEMRMSWYDARVHGMASSLPWPFSSAEQLQGCDLRVSETKFSDKLPPMSGKLLRTVEFTKRSEHATAIAQFLAGAARDADVMIRVLFPDMHRPNHAMERTATRRAFTFSND
jgi:hypothetical protein